MAIFNLYFASCALLLTLSWRASTGHPLPTLSPTDCEQCSALFRSLLLNITGLLDNDALCYGIISDEVVLGSGAETVLACAPILPQNSGCMMQINSSFNKSECLRNIMKDLTYYSAAFESYLRSPLRSRDEEAALLGPTLGVIQRLRENCFLPSNEESNSSEKDAAQMWGDDSFNNRQNMCKMMRGFYVRTITINRAMGYIASRDHRK